MRRAIIITMAIGLLLSKIAPISAQGIFIAPDNTMNLLLREYDNPPLYIPKLEKQPIGLIQIESNLDSIALGNLEFKTVYVKPLRLESYGELLDSYVQIIRLGRAKTQIMQPNVHAVDRKYIKVFLNPPKVDEEKLTRQQWKEFFGMDVWYPYYKAKEIEDWVKKRFSIKIWKFKGKPKFRRNRIDYIFKMRF
jgi:hypothetical protein